MRRRESGVEGRNKAHALKTIEADAGGQPRPSGSPELFGDRRVAGAAGSGGSRASVLESHEEPLSREELERMSPEQVNSQWQCVKAFVVGERG